MIERAPRYQIGQVFWSRGKAPRRCTVTDILTTRNAAGQIVSIRYVATHELCGQIVTDSNVVETTIAMALGNG